MKKTFSFNVSNKNRDRQTDSIKYEIKKYVARERRKTLPTGSDFWGFDCRIGATCSQSEVVHLNDINKSITKLEKEKEDSFYLEVLVKPVVRKKRISLEKDSTILSTEHE